MLLPEQPDDSFNLGGGDDGPGLGGVPDPLVTAEGSVCPWCLTEHSGTEPTEGEHECGSCGRGFYTVPTLSILWHNSARPIDRKHLFN